MKRTVLCGVSLTCLVGVVLATLVEEAGAAIKSPSPSALVAQSISNAESSGWVHEQVKASEKGHTFSANNRIGTSDGQQIIRADGAKAEVVLVNDIAYIKANAKGVANYFGLTTSDPQQLAGKWLSVTPTDAGYGTYTAAVTLQSDFSQLQLVGPYASGARTTIDHQSVIPVHGYVVSSSKGAKTPATLYVTATGKTLPIEFVVSTKAVHETEVWSAWSHPVYLSTPSNSEPIPNQ
jgi:hypothetical protein